MGFLRFSGKVVWVAILSLGSVLAVLTGIFAVLDLVGVTEDQTASLIEIPESFNEFIKEGTLYFRDARRAANHWCDMEGCP